MRLKGSRGQTDTVRGLSSRKRVMPQQIVSFLFALFLGVPSGVSATGGTPVPSAPTRATLARIEVHVTTTSDWTSVAFTPGTIVVDRIVSATRDTKVVSTGRGWTVRGAPNRQSDVIIRAVLEETSLSPVIEVAVRKGVAGESTVQVDNTSKGRFTVARVVDDLHTGTKNGRSRVAVQRSRAQVFGGADPVVRRGDPRRLVLAYYYPWFDRGIYDDPQLSTRPIEALGTRRAADVLKMTTQAAANGIDGFIVSWVNGARVGQEFDLALAAAERAGTVATVSLPLIDPALMTSGRVDPALVRRSISEALDRASSPAFLRSGGVPVIFAFAAGSLASEAWRDILSELAREGRSVRVVGDANRERHGNDLWGFSQYDPNAQTGEELTRWDRGAVTDLRYLATEDTLAPHLFAATVSPGIDPHRRAPGRPVVPRGDLGQRYALTWEAALASDPDWVLVTSWNEWWEGTGVQPSVAYGDLALRQTATFAARFKAKR